MRCDSGLPRRDSRRRILFLAGAAVIASGGAPDHAAAQTVTDPAALLNTERQLQQRLERQREATPTEGPVVEGGTQQTDIQVEPGGPTFLLRRIVFGESAFLSQEDLAGIASRYEGRQIDFAGLYSIVADVNAIYRERGIVTASAVLPPQDIDDGSVQVDLVEGRVGEVNLTGARTITRDFLSRRIVLEGGEVVDPPALSRQITRFNRTHIAQTRALLEPGREGGLTDIELAVIEPARNRFEISVDNLGNDSTGTGQLGLAFIHYGLLGIDDRLSVRATGSEGSISGTASYNFPVGGRGDRLGFSYSRNSISIIRGPFQQLDITGYSQNLALNTVHPLFVDARRLLTLNTEASAGTSVTEQSGFRTGEGETYKYTAGLTFSESRPGYSWWATANASVLGRHDRILNQWTTHALLNGAAAVQAPLTEGLVASATLAWQLGLTPFLPADQLFQIGGPATVRGYLANTFGGDSGVLANLELHHPMPRVIEGLGVFAFQDLGFTATATQPEQFLASAGAGVRWDKPDGLASASLTVAVPFRQAVPDQPNVSVYGRLRLAFE